MALGLTQSVTEVSTRNLLGGGGYKVDKPTAICEPIACKVWNRQRPKT
jgi:hypothetical protein